MEPIGLQLNQLRLVDALWRTGKLSEAAEQVGITQPAASERGGEQDTAKHNPTSGDDLVWRTL